MDANQLGDAERRGFNPYAAAAKTELETAAADWPDTIPADWTDQD